MTEQKEKVNFTNHLRPRTLPVRAVSIFYTFCLGGLSFLAFVVLGITGILLMFHYHPSGSYNSVVNLASVIRYGALLRSLHYWAAQVMVVSVFLHMCRVVWTHSYRPPRELNWVIGVILLVLTLVLDFSGILLRGSQETASAAAVAVHILQIIPVIGSGLARIFFGPAGTTDQLVLYVWHCVALPAAAFWLQGYHFWRIRRDGGARPL